MSKFFSYKFQNFHKATTLIVALFFCEPALADDHETAEQVRAKVTEGLIKGQKSELVAYLKKIQNNPNHNMKPKEAADLLLKISKAFVSRDAQESYESSLNASIDNPKEATKQVDLCLSKEPAQLDCLIQKLRLSYKAKTEKEIESTLKEIGELTRGTKYEIWTEHMARKTHLAAAFKTKMVSRQINETPTEEHFVMMVLELERSIQSKNYSRAKEISQYLTKNYPDYPDNIYFADKINDESRESSLSHASDGLSTYRAKCKTQNLSVHRKYRYDFDLCSRGL